MPTSADYQAAAIAAMTGNTVAPAQDALAPPSPSPEMQELDESKLDVTSNLETEPEVEAPKPPEKRLSLEAIAREKAAARAKKDSERPIAGLQAKLGPQGIHQLEQAMARGDVKGILSALGVKAGDVQYQAASEKIEEATAKIDPNVAALQQKIETMEREKQAEKMANGRARVLEHTKTLAAEPEFDLISDDPQAHDQAIKMVEEHIRLYNEMPHEDRDESIRMALRDVMEKTRKEAARWEKVLTKVKRPDKTQEESPEQPTQAVSGVGKSKTLTNSMSSAPVRPKTTPRTAADYQAAALAVLTKAP